MVDAVSPQTAISNLFAKRPGAESTLSAAPNKRRATVQKASAVKDEAEASDVDDATTAAVSQEVEPAVTESESDKLLRTIFVGNLPASVTPKQLKRHFVAYGEVDSVRLRSAAAANPKMSQRAAVITGEVTGDSIHAYVVFTQRTSIARAIAATGSLAFGRHLRIDTAARPGESSAAVSQHDSRKCVFLGNLPFDVTDETLWSIFGDCGQIQYVRVVREPKTQQGKGFGYIGFPARIGAACHRQPVNCCAPWRHSTARLFESTDVCPHFEFSRLSSPSPPPPEAALGWRCSTQLSNRNGALSHDFSSTQSSCRRFRTGCAARPAGATPPSTADSSSSSFTRRRLASSKSYSRRARARARIRKLKVGLSTRFPRTSYTECLVSMELSDSARCPMLGGVVSRSVANTDGGSTCAPITPTPSLLASSRPSAVAARNQRMHDASSSAVVSSSTGVLSISTYGQCAL